MPAQSQNGKIRAFTVAQALKTLTQQDYLAMREGAVVLEQDGYGDKVLRLSDGSILKLFRRKNLLSSAVLFPYARRFARNALTLARHGIPVPQVIALGAIAEPVRDFVHYRPLAGNTLRELEQAGLNGERRSELRDKLTQFIIHLHDKGVYFRSLHLGNVVLTPDGRLGLIDFSDLRVYPWSLGSYLRRRNMQRMLGIAADASWVDLPAIVAGRSQQRGGR
jgi:tRNA A-37 threonylcarbamoyl transferase component Bud32